MIDKKIVNKIENKVFFDSNIFVYSVDSSDSRKQVIAQNLLSNSVVEKNGIISTQNIQEFYNVCTKKFNIESKVAKNIIEAFAEQFLVVKVSLKIILKAIDIHRAYCISFYDSLIIATAICEGCVFLFTEDLNDGQIVEGVKIINPFK